jgi:predicted DNA-binding protein
MATSNTRGRIISFRVSDEEFARISRYCQATGETSTTGLVRSALESVIRQEPLTAVANTVEKLRRSITELEDTTNRMANMLTIFCDRSGQLASASELDNNEELQVIRCVK